GSAGSSVRVVALAGAAVTTGSTPTVVAGATGLDRQERIEGLGFAAVGTGLHPNAARGYPKQGYSSSNRPYPGLISPSQPVTLRKRADGFGLNCGLGRNRTSITA